MLYGGRGECSATQLIDLLEEGYSDQHMDAQRLRVNIEGFLANSGPDDDYDDQVRLRVVFLDEDLNELSTLDSLFAGEQAWVQGCTANDASWNSLFASDRIGRLAF